MAPIEKRAVNPPHGAGGIKPVPFQAETTSMLGLCTIHGRRHEFEKGCSYLLGRARDCDIVVEDVASSRHHARIHVGSAHDAATILDLQSRNGTYVNETRIEGPTPLTAGNRVRIGATVYLLAHAQAEEGEAMLDTGTQAMESLSLGQDLGPAIMSTVRRKGRSDTEIAGQLGVFSMVELLQMLALTSRSGTLQLALENGHGAVEIRQGEVVSSSFRQLEGLDALRALARASTGLFWLVETDRACPRTIEEPTSRLLLNLCWDMNAGGDG